MSLKSVYCGDRIWTELQPSSNIHVSAQPSSTDNHKLKAPITMYAVYL